jgi:hypothetical protein
MGISVLTRTVLKAFWIFGIIFIIFFLKDKIKKKIRYSLLFLAGHLLIVLPYHIRNYIAFNSPSPIEFHQGIAVTWMIIPLIENTNYSSLANKYPATSGIIKSLKGREMVPEKELKLSLKLTDIKLCKYLTLITLYTIKENPVQYLKLYIKNVINIITSSSSCLLIIDIFKNGFYEKQHKIFKEFVLFETKKDLKEILIILPNLFFRFINLILFIIFVVGIMTFYKNNNEITTFLIILFSYVIIVSSLALGYDRYRLPLEPLINIFTIYFLYNNIKVNI